MSIDAISDFDPLSEWLRSEEAGSLQKQLEEKIIRLLFNQSEPHFLQMAAQLAWIGARPENRPAILKEVIQLSLDSIDPCKCRFLKALNKVGHFFVEHKTEILVGIAVAATGLGLAVATGYAIGVNVCGVAVAGAGAVIDLSKEEKPPIPPVPPLSSKAEIDHYRQGLPTYQPQLNLPPSSTDLWVTSEGIRVNGQFYPNELLNQSHFADTYKELYPTFPPLTVTPSELPLNNTTTLPPSPSTEKPVETNPFPAPNIPSHEIPPVISSRYTLSGTKNFSGYIGWMNGINNTFEESKTSGLYLQGLAGGHAINGIYNCSHTPLVDLVEAGLLNHHGSSPITANLLRKEWTVFHETHADKPNDKLLWVCHSQGALHVRNALLNLPPEIRNRVIVIAIAPAAVVPKSLCFKSYNFASEKDIVYRFEPAPPSECRVVDGVGIPRVDPLPDYRDELIILPAHPGATGIDHEFQSLTYQPSLNKIIDKYLKQNGEYLPEDKGKD